MQDLRPVFGCQTCRLAVDPYLHILGVTQTDRTLLIHLHRWNILQHLTHTRSGGRYTLIHREHFLIQLKPHCTTLPYNLNLLQSPRIFLQINLTQTHLLTRQVDTEYLVDISHETDRNLVIAGLNLAVEPEHTILIGRRSIQRNVFPFTIHNHVGIIQRLLRTGIEHRTRNQVLRLYYPGKDSYEYY